MVNSVRDSCAKRSTDRVRKSTNYRQHIEICIRKTNFNLRFEFLKAALLRIHVFLDVKPCRLVCGLRHFEQR